MPKSKTPARAAKKTSKSTRRKTTGAKKTSNSGTVTPRVRQPPGAPANKQNYTEEYTEYLERYELYGEGRPRLSPSEFDHLDEELLDLLATEVEQGTLNDDQIVRVQELEYLLLDSEQ